MLREYGTTLLLALLPLAPDSCVAASGEIFAEIMASPESIAWFSPGHAFLCLEYHLNSGIKEECYGFYPKGGNTAIVGAPGLNDEFKRNPSRFNRITWSFKKKINSAQRQAFLSYISTVNARDYNLLNDNCADFVYKSIAKLGWRNVPISLRPESYVQNLYVANIARFSYPNGQILKSGDAWQEVDNNRVTFYFRSSGHDLVYLTLRDDSRHMDLQLPLRGGTSRWRQSGAWYNWKMISPPQFD